MYTKHEKVTLKDFGAEVRARLDIKHFLDQVVVMLDVADNSLEGVVELMLHSMLDSEEPACSVEEAKSRIFTSDSGLHLLARTMQGTCSAEDGANFEYDQSWICALCNLPNIQKRRVGICRLKQAANFGRNSHEVKLFVIVLCPSRQKGTKNALETGRTFCTILSDIEFRQELLEANTEEQFRTLDRRICQIGRGIKDDILQRLPHYWSDFVDGVTGARTRKKVLSTMLFLYFSCILPAIAFGVLNDHNTSGKIDVKKVVMGQSIGGIIFSLFSGQPLLVLLTTAPLALYIKIIYTISKDFDADFFAMYCAVGLWNSFFLAIYALFGVSRIMRWCTRSTEEIFSLFISIAFVVDAVKDLIKNFNQYYYGASHQTTFNATGIATGSSGRDISILFLLLMGLTVWLSVSLYNFNKTPYLQASKREALADYSLPMAVLIVSFIGSYFFSDVELERFNYSELPIFSLAPLQLLSVKEIFGAMLLGFPLLKKGTAYHLDLFIVSAINALLSIFGLPWMHATLPHSPLHVRGLADVEERVDQGHVHEIIVKVRETRITSLFSHILIGFSMFLLPYPLAYIPTAVLDGLFFYMAITALNGNQMYERITLLFMEQAAYPPNHYIRRVPQRKIHIFTAFQAVQLLVMCILGFAPLVYLEMIFPFIILLLLPVRHLLAPKFLEDKFLEALDGEHQ
ncbi:Sodium bicarbonate transporter-like protein 11 [Blattella germanica]|nr:Sodium bicarbonate transporter-like protein 11 [Blattella germanica]